MSDLRIVNFKPSGEIELTASMMHVPLSPIEAAIQRFIICFFTTEGSIADNPSWGGSGKKLFLKIRRNEQETKSRVSTLLKQTQQSLRTSEPDVDYRIVEVSLISIDRTSSDRGYNINVRLGFANATPTDVIVPGEVADVII